MTWDEPVSDDKQQFGTTGRLIFTISLNILYQGATTIQTRPRVQSGYMDFPMHPTSLMVGWCISAPFIKTQ